MKLCNAAEYFYELVFNPFSCSSYYFIFLQTLYTKKRFITKVHGVEIYRGYSACRIVNTSSSMA